MPGKFTGNRFYTIDNSKTTKFLKKQFFNISKNVKLNENGILNKSTTTTYSMNNSRGLEESIESFNSSDDKTDADISMIQFLSVVCQIAGDTAFLCSGEYHENNTDYGHTKSVSFFDEPINFQKNSDKWVLAFKTCKC